MKRNTHILLNLTTEDITFCTIIINTPFEDVVPSIRDVIDVIGHVKS